MLVFSKYFSQHLSYFLAVHLIEFYFSKAPIKGPNKQYDPHHFNPMFCNEYGGYEESGSKGRGRGSFRGR